MEELKEKKLLINFLTQVSKSASHNSEDEANVLIDLFVLAMKHLSPIDKQRIVDLISADYRIVAPRLYEIEDQELPF
jgi:hypothetical protein